MKKVTLKECKSLAEHLFELEGETIYNDTKFHFEFNGWLDKFGDNSIKYVGELTSKAEYVNKIAAAIKEDFDSEYWTKNDDGGMYHFLMLSTYGGWITECFENHLAVLTGVGYQLKLEIN